MASFSHAKKDENVMEFVLNMIRGFFMALADNVPGVSGGTIAFILGFYDEFIGSLYVMTHGDLALKKRASKFLANLGVGWVIGMGSSVNVLASLFTTQIYQLTSLFLGLSIFSPAVDYEGGTESSPKGQQNPLYAHRHCAGVRHCPGQSFRRPKGSTSPLKACRRSWPYTFSFLP